MGGGPPSPVASVSFKPAATAKACPLGSRPIDSAPQDTLEALTATGCPSTSSQSPMPSGDEIRGGKGCKENTEADKKQAQTATIIGYEKDSVADEVKAVNDGMLPEIPTNPISRKQLAAGAMCIYNTLELWEAACIEKDKALQPQTHHLLDVTIFLEKIPPDKLLVLQNGKKRPHDTIHEWFNKLRKEAEKSNKTPSTPKPIRNFATTPQDFPGKKITPQLPSPESCLHAFLMALASHAKAENWPEHEALARHITTELEEKSRQEAIDGKYLLTIGGKLVDELFHNFEEAKQEEGLLPQAEDTEKTSPETKRPPLVDNRPLDNRDIYKKVGNDYYLRSGNTWVPSYNGDQYQALVKSHGRLLGEHYDFLLASKHYLASLELHGLAETYDLPARMWRHGIYSFLDALRHRLPESWESMETFFSEVYNMMSLFEETVPYFRFTWIECKGDLARYRCDIERTDMKIQKHWKHVSQEEYTRVLQDDPTVGRLYHHLGVVARPESTFQPGARFDALVFQFFFLTKSLVVEKPFFAAVESLFFAIDGIVTKNPKSGGEATKVPQTDQDHFLTAVANLTLASLEQESLREHGYKTDKGQYLQTVHSALKAIGKPPCAKHVQTSRVRPSAQLGLLLCQMLLGIPHAARRWNPMMAAWAPDFVAPADPKALKTSMKVSKDLHEARIAMINTMVPYLLKDADTRDLRVWGFIYVILVFMRSLKTRPGLLKWVGEAFHAELIAPFVDLLLQYDKDEGRRVFERASRSGLTTLSLDCARRDGPTNPLPEDELLHGHFFAREASGIKEQLHDPPLFPNGWFENRRYNFDERRVRQDFAQDVKTCDDRSKKILCLAAQLTGVFFSFETDEKGCHRISVPGALPGPPLDIDMMPKAVVRDRGLVVVYVDPSEMEKNANSTEAKSTEAKSTEANRKADGDMEERSSDTDSLVNHADVEERVVEGVKMLAITPSLTTQEDEDYVLISTVDMEIADIAGIPKASIVADKSSSENNPSEQTECRHTKSNPEAPLQVRSALISQGTVGRNSGVDAGAATERTPDTILQTENATDVVEYWDEGDEGGWTHVSSETGDEA